MRRPLNFTQTGYACHQARTRADWLAGTRAELFCRKPLWRRVVDALANFMDRL